MNEFLKAHRHTKVIQCNKILSKSCHLSLLKNNDSVIPGERRKRGRLRAEPSDPKRTKGYF